MVDKLLRVGGIGEQGLAKPLQVGASSELLETITVAPSGEGSVYIQGGNLYSILAINRGDVSKSWLVNHLIGTGSEQVPARGQTEIIYSTGEVLRTGYGSRNFGYSAPIQSLGGQDRIGIINRSDVSLIFDIFKIDLPQNANFTRNKETNPISASLALTNPQVGAVIYDNQNKSRLDYFEMAFNKDNAFSVQISPYTKTGESGNAIGSVLKNGSNVAGINPLMIVNQGLSLFDVMAYEDGAYKFALNRTLEFPYGFKISITNVNGTGNIATRLYGVEEL